ncbi:MAG: hypothetical protein JRF27_01560, partial [Deltaproteobacteria bacterium]|nr:hypothetical protein [Deltaproteobacteria bacterium]
MEKDIKQRITTLLREIKIYREHSLFAEARNKCIQLAKLVQQSDKIENKKKLLAAVSRKIKALENDTRRFESVGTSVKISTKQQDIIKQLFHFSIGDEGESAALVAAEAMLVFGQFDKALSEFNGLLKIDSFRVDAAKNILRCHIGLSALDDAVSQYREWSSDGPFSPEQLGKIHHFLQDILDKKGMAISLPKPKTATDIRKDKTAEDEFVDILSILIPQDIKTQKGDDISLDVNFQRENMINVIIPRKNSSLGDGLKIGMKIE